MPKHYANNQVIYEKLNKTPSFSNQIWKSLKIGFVLGTIAGLLALGYTVEQEPPEKQSLLAQVMKPVAEKLLTGLLKVVTNKYFYGTLGVVLIVCTALQLLCIFLIKKNKNKIRGNHKPFFNCFNFCGKNSKDNFESFSDSLDLGSLQSLVYGTLRDNTLKRFKNGQLLETPVPKSTTVPNSVYR